MFGLEVFETAQESYFFCKPVGFAESKRPSVLSSVSKKLNMNGLDLCQHPFLGHPFFLKIGIRHFSCLVSLHLHVKKKKKKIWWANSETLHCERTDWRTNKRKEPNSFDTSTSASIKRLFFPNIINIFLMTYSVYISSKVEKYPDCSIKGFHSAFNRALDRHAPRILWIMN